MIPKFTEDLSFIRKLEDEPNDVGGMTAEELKMEFDKAGLEIQRYINETLIPATEEEAGHPYEVGTSLSNPDLLLIDPEADPADDDSTPIGRALTADQKAQMKALMDSYYSASTGGSFVYDYNTIPNDHANSRCISDGRVKLNCSAFVGAVWMGRQASDYVGKTAGNYTSRITKAFDWGWLCPFTNRSKLGGLARRGADGSVEGFFNFHQPNADDPAEPFKDSYSTTTIYDPSLDEGRYPKKQWFRSFQTAAELAQQLYKMGCEIQPTALDVGDIVFTTPRGGLSDERDTFLTDMAWRRITHVALVYDKKSDGTLVYMDCTDRVSGDPILKTSLSFTNPSDICEAGELEANAVMCARHPAAYHLDNMADVEAIPYQLMRYPDGRSNNAIPVNESGGAMTATETKAGLYYTYRGEVGTAKTTGTVSEWSGSNFTILFTNKEA